jgi:hypothetical protein
MLLAIAINYITRPTSLRMGRTATAILPSTARTSHQAGPPVHFITIDEIRPNKLIQSVSNP